MREIYERECARDLASAAELHAAAVRRADMAACWRPRIDGARNDEPASVTVDGYY